MAIADELNVEEELLWEPSRAVPPDSWTGHVPFAFWLIKAIKPNLFVELGTHSGNSYSAFCQAIAALNLPTRAFAVDTWKGDQHSGLYGEEVYDNISNFNARYYGQFSTLLRQTFDEARQYFSDGTVDLLHIDGLHTYEQVRHDFEKWRTTLSSKAVVVLHDTNVRERNFGVWALWQELAEKHPSFEFIHSHGLGVVGVGADQQPLMQRLFDIAQDPTRTADVRRIFSARGIAVKSYVAVAERDLLVKSLRAEMLRSSQEELERNRAEMARVTISHKAEIEKRDRTIAGLDNELHLRSSTVNGLQQDLAGRDRAVARQLEEHQAVLLVIQQQHEEALREARIDEHAKAVSPFVNSTSWRLTAPLRAAATMLRHLRNQSRPGDAPSSSPQGLAAPDEEAAPAAGTSNAATSDASKIALRAGLMARLKIFLETGAELRLPDDSAPDISIIIILFNQSELTFGCLESIRACMAASSVTAEVIIVDNGSSDDTPELLQRVQGARIISLPENLHFLRGVNRASEAATGDYILLLNNDAQILPGSLEAALAVFHDSADVGAVGGPIVLPDGTLQEAGSIIWNDGTCSGYGRGWDPHRAECVFRRDVDYCSGAFLLTPRRLFERLGGLDARYSPAYYEETDYCVRLWQAGYRVVYEPRAVIIHYEFGSSATAAAIELQRRNLDIFQRRNAYWLRGQLPRSDDNVILARASRSSSYRVLMIEDRIPHPALGAGYPRANDIIASLVAIGASVTFYPMIEQIPERWSGIRESIPQSVEVMNGLSHLDLAAFLSDRAGFYQCIIISRPHNMRAFSKAITGNPQCIAGARIVYDAEAIFAHREAIKASLLGQPLSQDEQKALIADELSLTDAADIVVSVSPAEARAFEDHGSPDVRIIGFSLATDLTTADFEARTDIVFLGAVREEDGPNADSIRWFCESVLPRIQRGVGFPIRLTIIGLVEAETVRSLEGVSVDLVGQVDDLIEHFAKARVMVAPTRFSAGIPHKVAKAAAMGVPTVATNLIAEQLGWQPGRDLLASSNPDEFADLCIRLYQDAELWAMIRDNAVKRCRLDYAPLEFQSSVERLLADVPRRDAIPHNNAGVSRDYDDWLKESDHLTRSDRDAIDHHIRGFPYLPLISVVVPLYNTPEKFLRQCIESVRSQLYPNWELCLVDDASPLTSVGLICEEYAATDIRIKFERRRTNGHIAAATNTCLELAQGKFVAFLDHDDELAPHALYMVVEALNRIPEADLIYTDEDKIDADGRRFEPWFKSDWNYDLMLSQNAIVHLAVYRHSLLREIGGLRAGFDGSQDYDLSLRFIERTTPERIIHVPMVLYHWRAIPGSVAFAAEEKMYPYEAAKRAIQEHLDRMHTAAEVTAEAHLGYYRVHWPLPETVPHVSIIIPTKDRVDLLKTAVDSIISNTDYQNYDIIIVDNRSTTDTMANYLRSLSSVPRVSVVQFDQPYSFAALNNWAVGTVTSEIVAFVNNDIEVISAGWLSEMVSHAVRPDVGAVGAKLYYPDDTVQHAGIVVGIGGTAGHPHVGLPRGQPGYFGRAVVAQRFSAVTAACLVIRRLVFLQIGGFDEEHFAIAYNDVDLGLRLRRAGYGVVWTPYAELYHHESASLGSPSGSKRQKTHDQERCHLKLLWSDALANDPFYNPNLTLTGGDFAPCHPSRVERPWYQKREYRLMDDGQERPPGSFGRIGATRNGMWVDVDTLEGTCR